MLFQDLDVVNGRIVSKDQQKEISFQGLTIVIENSKGSTREWETENEKGSTKMLYPYGYIQGTKGNDGDEIDCFVGPNSTACNVYIVRQNKVGEDGQSYDEDKVFLGWDSMEEVKKVYMDHYDSKEFLGNVVEMPIQWFRETL